MATGVTARSTQGMGEMIAALLDAGVRRFMIGLGGSSTNDGGAGMLTALGLRVVDAAGRDVAPTPDGLAAMAARRRERARPAACANRRSRSCRTSTTRSAASAARRRSSVRRRACVRRTSRPSTATLARYAALAERAVGRSAAEQAGRRRGRRTGLRAAARRRIVSLRRRGRGGPDRSRRRARAARRGR